MVFSCASVFGGDGGYYGKLTHNTSTNGNNDICYFKKEAGYHDNLTPNAYTNGDNDLSCFKKEVGDANGKGEVVGVDADDKDGKGESVHQLNKQVHHTYNDMVSCHACLVEVDDGYQGGDNEWDDKGDKGESINPANKQVHHTHHDMVSHHTCLVEVDDRYQGDNDNGEPKTTKESQYVKKEVTTMLVMSIEMKEHYITN
eukprot:13334996-Ditylum_brightwellii.AAC.1